MSQRSENVFKASSADCSSSAAQTAFQIGHKGLQILVRYIPGRIPDLVDDTVLDLSLREHLLASVVKPGQVICTGDKNVLYPAVSQAVEYGCPELGALIFSNPKV